jgi:HAD superfamily hydrolase (TIGR01509 family)
MYFRDPLLSAMLDGAKAVIFDLNGLIVDDEPLQLAATNQMLVPMGVTLSEEYWIRNCVGRRATDFLEQVFEKNNLPQMSLQTSIEKKNEYYGRLVRERYVLLVRPGFHYLLIALESKPLAVVTSATGEEVDMVLGAEALNLLGRFAVIVCGREAERGKPFPDSYLLAASKLGVDPQECLVFEDSAVGVEAARRAGMKVVAVPNRYTQGDDFSQANAVISNLLETAKPLKQ